MTAPHPMTAADLLRSGCTLPLTPVRAGTNQAYLRGWSTGTSMAQRITEADRHPDVNVGLLMDGLWALDADGPEAADTLRAYIQAHAGVDVLDPEQDAVWAQRTPSGGIHLIFRCRPGQTITSRPLGRTGIAALDATARGDHSGVEVIGHGKQVVIHPSVRRHGTYTTLGRCYLDPQYPPDGLAALVAAVAGEPDADQATVQLNLTGDRHDLDRAAVAITTAAPGTGNQTLYQVAQQVIGQARTGSVYSEAEAVQALLQAGRSRPRSNGAEVARTVASAATSNRATTPAQAPPSRRGLLDAAQPLDAPWPDPSTLALDDDYPTPPAFDAVACDVAAVDALVGDLIATQHQADGTPPAFAVGGLLHGTSQANAGHYRFGDPSGSSRVGTGSLHTNVIGPSGVGKTGSLLTERLTLDLVDQDRVTFGIAANVHASHRAALLGQVAQAEKALGKGAPVGVHGADPLAALRDAHQALAEADAHAPVFRFTHATGGTPQGTEAILARHGFVTISSQEGITVMRAYLGGKGQVSHTAQLVEWLDGQTGRTAFATQDDRVVVDPGLAMLLQAQPSAFAEMLAQDPAALTNGLFARTLFVLAHHEPPRARHAAMDQAVVGRVRDRLAALVAHQPAGPRRTDHPVVAFSADAQDLLNGYHVALMDVAAVSRATPAEQAQRSRGRENAARFAFLLHLFTSPTNADQVPISGEAAVAGMALADYSRTALAYLVAPSRAGSSDPLEVAVRIADMTGQAITTRHVKRATRSWPDDRRQAALQHLVDSDWVRVTTSTAANRASVQHLTPHPLLHTLIAQEHDRRKGTA